MGASLKYEGEYLKYEWEKHNPGDKIWWLASDMDDNGIFSFNKKDMFPLFASYPWDLTKEQRQIFDKENPYWANFFSNRMEGWDKIDTTFDFTSELPKYWEGFWDRNDGFGKGGCDPDAKSPTLQEYHRILWSRPLPNGKWMQLTKRMDGGGNRYLYWDGFRLSSDSIIIEMRYKQYRHIIQQVMDEVGDYKTFYEKLLRKSYTIGGMVIFPKHVGSMNQNRGTNKLISDRWDLTMECIRRYYAGEKSPLSKTLKYDKAFFDLFVDFKGYVDFFFLQDCVSEDYSKVDIWNGDGKLTSNGRPKTKDEYLTFINRELEFLDKRNARIKAYFS